MPNTVEIETDILRAALCAVSYDKGRAYLHGVYFDPRGWIAATNRHVIFAARVPAVADWGGAGRILHGVELAQAVKGKARNVVLDMTGPGVMAGSVTGKTYVPLVDGAFPSWGHVIPAVGGQSGDKVAPAHFLPDPVKAVHAMAKALGETAYIVPSDPRAPHPVVFGGRKDCFAVIMPARLQVDPAGVWAAMERPL
jgi:hypothetical protein